MDDYLSLSVSSGRSTSMMAWQIMEIHQLRQADWLAVKGEHTASRRDLRRKPSVVPGDAKFGPSGAGCESCHGKREE